MSPLDARTDSDRYIKKQPSYIKTIDLKLDFSTFIVREVRLAIFIFPKICNT